MTDRFDDRLIERELQEVLGGDTPGPELEARLLQAAGAGPVKRIVPARAPGRRITAPVPRRSMATAWFAAAAALVVTAAIVAGVVAFSLQRPAGLTAPQADGTAGTSNRSVTAPGASSATERRPEQARPPAANGAFRDQHEPAEVEPLPALPRTPGDNTEEPAQQPEPAPQPPQPEPKRDVIDKPQPGPASPDTTSPPAQPAARVVVGNLAGADRVKARLADTEPWVDFEGGDLLAGMQLKTAKAASFQLAGGAAVRFEGELALKQAHQITELVLLARRSELLVDNAGCAQPCRVVASDFACTTLGVLHAEHEGAALALMCFEGSAQIGTFSLAAMQRVRVTDKGAGKPVAIKPADARPQIIKDAPARVLARGDFEAQGGVARVSGANADIAALLGEMKALPGAVLKLRYRVTGGKALYVQLQQTAGDLQFGKWVALARVGDWQELEVALADLARDDGKGEGPPAPGEVLRALRVFVQDGDKPTLEIDWFEVSRRAN